MEEGAARGESLVDYDSAFHVAIAQATGNGRSSRSSARSTRRCARPASLSFRPEAAPAQAISDHVAILSAIRERTPSPRRPRCAITSTASRA